MSIVKSLKPNSVVKFIF